MLVSSRTRAQSLLVHCLSHLLAENKRFFCLVSGKQLLSGWWHIGVVCSWSQLISIFVFLLRTSRRNFETVLGLVLWYQTRSIYVNLLCIVLVNIIFTFSRARSNTGRPKRREFKFGTHGDIFPIWSMNVVVSRCRVATLVENRNRLAVLSAVTNGDSLFRWWLELRSEIVFVRGRGTPVAE